MRYLIGRYHEIALKGRNRWRFVEQLKQNARGAFADVAIGPIRGEGPRMMIELPNDLPEALVKQRATAIFGLQNFSISYRVDADLEEIRHGVLSCLNGIRAESFRIEARRDDKRFPLNSPAIEREIGASVKQELGIRVDLENAELTINIEILPRGAYFAIGKHPGAGGLPVGISGRGMTLISGGIDSPVAAYRMMKRGLRLDFVHFHSVPLLSRASQEKVTELLTMLTRFQNHSTLFMVAFGELQREIVAKVPRPLRVVLYRRFMVRIAAALARRTRAEVLVTGESLGQVASQTLDNMTVIENASSLPLLRPLVGMDKQEIITHARQLGTFETSILPDQDCCTLFVPAHPETHSTVEQVEAAEAALDVKRMVDEGLERSERVEFSFPKRTEPITVPVVTESRWNVR